MARKRKPLRPNQPIAKTRIGMKKLTVVVTPELRRALKRLAVEEDTTMDKVIRRAIEIFLQIKETSRRG